MCVCRYIIPHSKLKNFQCARTFTHQLYTCVSQLCTCITAGYIRCTFFSLQVRTAETLYCIPEALIGTTISIHVLITSVFKLISNFSGHYALIGKAVILVFTEQVT